MSAASPQAAVFVPVLGAEFIPDPRFRRRADDFAALGGGLEYARALRADLGMTVNVDLRQRWHAVAGRADGDRRLLGFSVGLQRRLRPALEGDVRFSLLGSDYDRLTLRYVWN